MISDVFFLAWISIHALREEGDASWQRPRSTLTYFYPRPPRGGRPTPTTTLRLPSNFYPRPPRGGRHRLLKMTGKADGISIHALREEGDRLLRAGQHLHQISIHALREEGDLSPCPNSTTSCYFYPRPPRGGRPAAVDSYIAWQRFLSTPSARRATGHANQCAALSQFLSTPSSRRATFINVIFHRRAEISIHALREEGDAGRKGVENFANQFLSTPSARRATGLPVAHPLDVVRISIHALREEGDVRSFSISSSVIYF